ncbi:hypothetical protein ACROYT_G036830 [Oculina patagonica]
MTVAMDSIKAIHKLGFLDLCRPSSASELRQSTVSRSFATVLVLHVVLSQIKISASYQANDPQEFLHAEPDDQEIQTNDVISSKNATHRDAQYDVTNTSSVLLSLEHAHGRTARQVSGCRNGKAVVHCGKDLIVTYKCRKRSVTCIQYGGAAPRCVKIKSYFPACQKVFTVDCQCEGKRG